MPSSKVWTINCIGILCALLLISIIIAWASKEAYREYADNDVNNKKMAGDLVDWNDYINVQSHFKYVEAFPHVDENDSHGSTSEKA